MRGGTGIEKSPGGSHWWKCLGGSEGLNNVGESVPYVVVRRSSQTLQGIDIANLDPLHKELRDGNPPANTEESFAFAIRLKHGIKPFHAVLSVEVQV